MWRSMQKYGCHDGPRHDNFYESCRCLRQSNLRVLNALQGQAHAQIRTRLRLTIGKILPRELFDAIFEYALVVEGIPAEPTVLLSPSERSEGETSVRSPWKKRNGSQFRAQSLFKVQYQ